MDQLGTIRKQFPALHQTVNGHPLVYLDNAATSQKPEAVIRAVETFYRTQNANVHRGAHQLSDQATGAFEAARSSVRRFINAASDEEIIWTRGTTEGINLIAQSYARPLLKAGDEILLTELEHHANIVPWQVVAEQTGAKIRVVPITENGDLNLPEFSALLSNKTRIVSLTHISNALGTINPVAGLVRQAHEAGAVVVIDGAQAAPHLEIDVQRLGCDFYLFSGHKLFAPTGIGVLYGRKALLEAMPPWQGGGEMIKKVSFSGTTYNKLPFKFEAGTPNISGALGLAEAIRFLSNLDRKALARHERALMSKAIELCSSIPGFTRISSPTACASILSFQLNSHHQQDVGLMLDQQGIAVRTGHHCAMPLMERLELPGTVRASFCFYNTFDDVERFAKALQQIAAGGTFSRAETVSDQAVFDNSPFGRDIDDQEILKRLTTMGSWNDRYREIMLLGKKLPTFTAAMKTEQSRISGCESDAWLQVTRDKQGALWFAADSDARIIRGLIALVLAAFNGQQPANILSYDVERYFTQLQLTRHLSPSRGNGLKAIINAIKEIARKQAGNEI
ncbi:SufS family cysteine desulfurase [Amphritea japonica]|uniref:cysteine desulfurase n=1 Tax=Amphritea japonica ATCC BAA-1530 TaxID=1278309 RepID=A0A7R6PGF4_9GAMM|nr:SufS family cysteine desulfurase [Amphritea japonica]BBB26007.1 cysteine desulfurase/selenocysteine lyase [Amphritea japonica ATCC BAA-1530]